MIKTYFITSLRNILKHKLTTAFNVLGLAVGLASGILILNYVQYEFSYDQFHTQKDRIYRIQHDFLRGGQVDFQSARTFPKIGPVILADYPEVESYCRIFQKYRGAIVRHEDVSFKEDKLLYVDTTFFKLFSYSLLEGNPASVLKDSHTAVVEEVTARKYFGDENPIGKRISVGSINGLEEFEITGVVRSPANSQLQFDFLFSYASLIDLFGEGANSTWGWYDFYTYLLLREGTNASALEAKFPVMLDKYGGENRGSKRIQLHLQPLTSIHLTSKLMMEANANGDLKTVYFLSMLAGAILLIAWINYLNMATAGAVERAKEVGVRKVVGASRVQLGLQFVAEAAMVNFASVVLSLGIIALVLPAYNSFTGYSLELMSFFSDLAFWDKVVILFLFGSLLSGIYPAVVLSAYKPAAVLKGKWRNSSQGLVLRKALVIVQFMASVTLIAGTIIVYRQLYFMQHQELGVKLDNVLVVKAPDVVINQHVYYQQMETYKSEVLRCKGVEEVTMTSEIPGKKVSWYNGSIRVGDASGKERVVLYVATVDHDYFDLLGLELAAGRTYSKEVGEDTTNIVINERAVGALGIATPEEALQQKIVVAQDTLTIIGVIKDYYHESPKEAFDPTIYRLMEQERNYFAAKISGTNVSELIEEVKAKYELLFPGTPFEYFFLNDFYQGQYANERNVNQIFNAFSAIAIIVASLGLFGLASFTIAQRTKEIGIRKVLGSSIQSVFILFTKDFLKLILIANAMAIPLVLVMMEKWLDNFAQRITIGVGVFVVAALATLIIAMVSVGYHALKAALINPVETLKYE